MRFQTSKFSFVIAVKQIKICKCKSAINFKNQFQKPETDVKKILNLNLVFIGGYIFNIYEFEKDRLKKGNNINIIIKNYSC